MGTINSKVYNICKNVFAKWCFPNKNPEKVTQEEINIFLDNSPSINVSNCFLFKNN